MSASRSSRSLQGRPVTRAARAAMRRPLGRLASPCRRSRRPSGALAGHEGVRQAENAGDRHAELRRDAAWTNRPESRHLRLELRAQPAFQVECSWPPMWSAAGLERRRRDSGGIAVDEGIIGKTVSSRALRLLDRDVGAFRFVLRTSPRRAPAAPHRAMVATTAKTGCPWNRTRCPQAPAHL